VRKTTYHTGKEGQSGENKILFREWRINIRKVEEEGNGESNIRMHREGGHNVSEGEKQSAQRAPKGRRKNYTELGCHLDNHHAGGRKNNEFGKITKS